MEVVILATGGLDSTYLIQKACLDKNILSIKIAYTYISNNRDKPELELKALESIIEYYNMKYNKYITVSYSEISINNSNCGDINLPQLPLHMLQLMYLQSSTRKDSEIWIGYVMGDDAASFIDDINSTYKSFAWLNHSQFRRKLRFPVLKRYKHDIYAELPQEVIDLIWFCEEPLHGKECGNCNSCKKYKMYGLFNNRFQEKFTKKFLDEH